MAGVAVGTVGVVVGTAVGRIVVELAVGRTAVGTVAGTAGTAVGTAVDHTVAEVVAGRTVVEIVAGIAVDLGRIALGYAVAGSARTDQKRKAAGRLVGAVHTETEHDRVRKVGVLVVVVVGSGGDAVVARNKMALETAVGLNSVVALVDIEVGTLACTGSAVPARIVGRFASDIPAGRGTAALAPGESVAGAAVRIGTDIVGVDHHSPTMR